MREKKRDGPDWAVPFTKSEDQSADDLFWLEEDSLDRAREEYIGWLRQVKECTASGKWPGPGPVESELAAPAWAVTDNEAVDFDGVEE